MGCALPRRCVPFAPLELPRVTAAVTIPVMSQERGPDPGAAGNLRSNPQNGLIEETLGLFYRIHGSDRRIRSHESDPGLIRA